MERIFFAFTGGDLAVPAQKSAGTLAESFRR
jgi:hypothetical protein